MALFFHDPYGGDVIGILWKPNMLRAAPFKVKEGVGEHFGLQAIWFKQNDS